MQKKTLAEQLAPVVGLPPTLVEDRLTRFGEKGTSVLSDIVKQENVSNQKILAAFNMLAVETDRQLTETEKAVVGPEPKMESKR